MLLVVAVVLLVVMFLSLPYRCTSPHISAVLPPLLLQPLAELDPEHQLLLASGDAGAVHAIHYESA